MAAANLHSAQTKNHRLESFVFADAAARIAGTGYTLTADDVGKIGYQTDLASYFRLTSYSPITWVENTGVITRPVSDTTQTLQPGNDTAHPLILKRASASSAVNLFQVDDYEGTNLFRITSAGLIGNAANEIGFNGCVISNTFIKARKLTKSLTSLSSPIVLTTDEAARAVHEYTGTLTGNVEVHVPDALVSANGGGSEWVVYNNTSGGYTITFRSPTYVGLDVPTGLRDHFYATGSAIRIAKSSYTNATHTHQSTAQGGTLDAAAIAAGTLAVARGGTASGTAAGARSSLGAAASGANADITSLTGLTGAITGNAQPLTGSKGTQAMADANQTPAAAVYQHRYLEVTGALTANRDLVLPNVANAGWVLINSCTGAYSVQVKVSGQTGIAIANGKTAMVRCDGTDIKRVTADV